MINKTIAHYKITSKLGLRPKPGKELNHRGHRGAQREKKENGCGDSLSVSSALSVVKHFCMPKAYPDTQVTLW